MHLLRFIAFNINNYISILHHNNQLIGLQHKPTPWEYEIEFPKNSL